MRGIGRAGVDVDDAFCDGREAGIKMIGRFDEKQGLFFRIDAEIRKYVRLKSLGAVGVEDDFDIRARDPDQRRGAERNAARAETLPGFCCRPYNLDLRVDRRAAIRPRLAAKTKLQPGAFAGRQAEGNGYWVPDRRHREIVEAALQHTAQDQRAVARDASAGIVPDVGNDGRLAGLDRHEAQRRI